MTWLFRLKNKNNARTSTTETTKTVSVVSVVPHLGHINKIIDMTCPSNVLSLNPNIFCWPQSSAMNGRELEKFIERLARFKHLGLNLDVAENLADRLLLRDRDKDDRSICLECAHLKTGWRCLNLSNSGVFHQKLDQKLPASFVIQLQRCPGANVSLGQVMESNKK